MDCEFLRLIYFTPSSYTKLKFLRLFMLNADKTYSRNSEKMIMYTLMYALNTRVCTQLCSIHVL